MSLSHEDALLTILQPFRYRFALFALVCSLALHASGQKAPGSASPPPTKVSPAQTNKSCEGTPPPPTSSHQGPSTSQSATESGGDRLKLSTKSEQESADPEGQFCRRDRSGQNSLRPSVKSDSPEDTPEPAHPGTTPPVAQVTDGKLTITTNGQDFASVLESVRSVAGFMVEMPPGVDSEPVFLNVGPASVTDALVALLHGTNYNYIIVGSEQDPRVVKRLILTARANAGPATLVASTQGSAVALQPGLYGGQGFQSDTDAEASEPPPPPPVPVQPAAIPSSVPVGINIQKLAAESGKTPGQILDELQKRQQQMLDEQAAQSQSAPQQ